MSRSHPTTSQLHRLLEAAHGAAVEAGALLKRNADKAKSVRYKGKIDLVTEMDLRSERLIVKRLRRVLPSSAFLTEEETTVAGESEFRWVIDPLDGTTNYAHNFPVWCVSIALEYSGEIVLACVYDPTREELFTATIGTKARRNGRPIAVTRRRNLSHSLLATGFPYDVRTSRIDNLDHFANFVKAAQAVRRAGSAALDLCYLAAGRFDGFWELKLHPWDTAAAVLIVKQAGGEVTDFRGKPFSIYSDNILASNGKIHRQLIKVLAKGRRMPAQEP